MTTDEYLNDHIPHRFNVLSAFRTRYSNRHRTKHSLTPEAYRDLFRCAKDACLIMTRFFFEELGIKLDRKTQQCRVKGSWASRHNITQLPLQNVLDHRCHST